MTEFSGRLMHIYSKHGYPVGAINADIKSRRGRPLHMKGGFTLEEAAIMREALVMWRRRLDAA
jgi:hypothetical protein